MALPANVNKVPIHCSYVDFAGVACTGTITFVPSAYQSDPSADTVLLPLPTTVVLNLANNGAYQTGPGEFLIGPSPAGLICTDDPDLLPGFYYHVIEKFDGQNAIEYDLLVPVANSPSTTIHLSDVDRQLQLVPAPQIYVSTINGLSGNVSLPFGSPVVSAVGDTGADGVATSFARSDHKHGREAFGAATAQTTYAQSAANGVATTLARSDHAHGTVSLPTPAAIGAIPAGSGISNFSAGLHSTRPAAGNVGAVWVSTDRKTLYRDDGTTWQEIEEPTPIASNWTAFGHSYLGGVNTWSVTARVDGYIRRLFGVSPNNWKNYGISGSKMTYQGASQGGWTTMWREIKGQVGLTFPQTPYGGGFLFMFGINDLGGIEGATALMQTAWGHVNRAMISRARASRMYEDTDGTMVFSGGWSNGTGLPDQASAGTFKYRAGAVTGDTCTITLPADYKGEVVAINFIGRPGPNGCTYTLSGSALAGNPANGTTVQTSNIMPALSFSHVPVVKRITGLSSANASQTIIATITTNANEGQIDGWWLEAEAPPPVIVCDTARPTAAAIAATYPSWVAQTGSHDNDVAAFNTVLDNVIAEFDTMVQRAYIDTALAKDANNFADGLHPNARGAAKAADAVEAARRLLRPPTTTYGRAASLVPPAMHTAPARIRRVSGQYYTSECSGAGSNYTAVSGDLFAIPFEVTEPDEAWNLWGCWAANAVSGTTVRIGIASDYQHTGYPDLNLQELTAGGALTVPNAIGLASTNGGGYLWKPDNAGFYWLWLKFCAIGVAHTFKTIAGPVMGMPQTTAGDIATPPAGWKLTGQGTAALPSTFPTGGTPIGNVPYVVMRKA